MITKQSYSPILIRCFWCFFISLSFVIYLRTSIAPPICFDDCFGYIPLMGKSFFSWDYWQTLFAMFRPFTIPMIYSFFGKFNPNHLSYIVYFQTLFAFFAWLAFSYSIAKLIKTKPFDSIIFVIFILAMFGRGSSLFNQYLLSDSMALSFILLWFAVLMHSKKIIAWSHETFLLNRIIFMCLFAVFTLAVAYTRDTNALIILFGIPLLLTIELPQSQLSKYILITIILYISLVCQIQAGARHQVNMLHIITGVVLNDPEKREFFAQRGMPLNEQILQDNGVMQPWKFFDLQPKVFNTEVKKVMSTMEDFLKNAKTVYTKYLLLHPEYVAKNIYLYHDYMLNQSFFKNKENIAWGKLSLMDDIPAGLLAVLGLLFIVSHYMLPPSLQREKYFLFCSVILMFAGLSNAVIAFHGDFWELSEMQRHPFIGSIFFRIGCMGMILGTCVELFYIFKADGK